MAANRLLEAFTQFDSYKADSIFGDEFAGDPLSVTGGLAPVKRVALFAESFLPKVDGVSKTAYLTLRYLQETGREVLVFAPDIAPTQLGASRIVPMPSLGFNIAPETRIALPNFAINHYLDDFQPDLIHLFNPALLSLSGVLAGRRRHIPIIANYQTDIPAYALHYGLAILARPSRAWLRFIHNGCHLTLAPSNYTLTQLKKWGYKRLRRWGRGVNGNRFNPAKCTSEWRNRLLNGRDPHSLICIYAGRLANEKRVDLLAEVARTPGVALTIIGDGARREELERQFAGTQTHFMGYLYGEDLAHAYASADVFMFTGPSETFGQVVQEAMASGLPAVVINQGGVVDLVEDGKTGYICAANPQAFAAAARELRDHPELRLSLGYNARCFAEKRPWSIVMGELETHYREAVKLSQRAARVKFAGRFALPIRI
jgi:glycosyltransferase involved in cell wall biosynthesis